MKWEKSKKEETKVHESHFSMFQLIQSTTNSVTTESTPSKAQTHSGNGNEGTGLWEPRSRDMVDESELI